MINILQIVDSLAIGGKEKMVVNLANTINKDNDFKSFVCTTTNRGPLANEIDKDIEVLNLSKNGLIDISSIKNLINFIQKNKIHIIHAHSSSFFISVLISFFVKVKIIWHDHNGNRKNMPLLQKIVLKLFSFRFDYIICVNENLKKWAFENLFIKKTKISYLPNFISTNNICRTIELPGEPGKRIVSIANLRFPKNHMFLLKCFNKILKKEKNWHLILVGNDYFDSYSKEIKEYMKDKSIENNVHILGARNDVSNILHTCDIGVLSSESEGLPVSILEYGIYKLPVVCTNVGDCKKVIKNEELGFISESNDVEQFSDYLKKLILEPNLRAKVGQNYYEYILNNYSDICVINKVLKIYKEVLV